MIARICKTFFLALLVGVTSCASSRMSNREIDSLFRRGQFDQAASILKEGLEKEGTGRDQLLWLMDLGLTLHSAGRYEESNKYLLEADKIAEIKDYTSLATEAGTLLTTDNIKQYQGEDFEKVMISVYLAINYALQGKTEDAIVEAKRVNRKLTLMINDGQRKYKLNEFARYLSGVLYESNLDFGDAYIDYKETHKLKPEFTIIGPELWRMAWLTRNLDDADDWKREFGLSENDINAAKMAGPKSTKGEIVIIYENGISPIKRPNPQFNSLPAFFPRHNPSAYAEIKLNGSMTGYRTTLLHDIEATAIKNLDEKYGGLIAKKLAGVVVKEVVANQVERQTDSPLLGFLTRVVMYASDTADVRSWSLLPRDLQIARIVVDPGTYHVQLHPVGVPSGLGDQLAEKVAEVKAGRKTFLNFRYTPSF